VLCGSEQCDLISTGPDNVRGLLVPAGTVHVSGAQSAGEVQVAKYMAGCDGCTVQWKEE
jgi:hypothetical protein